MTEQGWSRWFAWRWIKIDGRRTWLRTVERRRVVIAEDLAPFSAPYVDSFWQYRLPQEN